jgi:superfamily II DNA or RNA helicase
MRIELWPHQREAVDAAHIAITEGRDKGLWVMPTGSGKTVAFCTLAKELGQPTLVVVHRDELLRQAAGAFEEIWPKARVGTLGGEDYGSSTVLVATVQSLKNKLGQIPPDRFSLVVIDEAHHAPAKTWGRVIEHFRPGLLLGCTATPKRLDGEDILPLFGDEVLYEYGLGQAMQDDHLVPARQKAVYTQTDLSGLKAGRGDFSEKALAPVVVTEARTRAVVDGYLEHGEGRPALVFAVNLDHASQIRKALEAVGVPAASVTGKMDPGTRQQVLADFGEGKLRVLVSCQVLTEGYDEPGVSCVVMARPTKSQALYAQCVGRGLRVDPERGKKDCLVLDVVDRACRHRVVVASDLFGARVVDCRGQDIREAARQERARWPLEPLSPTASKEARWDLGEETPWEELPDLRGYKPTQRWQVQPASEKQLKRLAGYGFERHRALTQGEADYLLDQCKELDARYLTPPTPKQERVLRARGLWFPGMSKRQAGAALGTLWAGAWR